MTDVLVDTNVLGYSTDVRDHRKREIALEVLRRLRSARALCVSPQVLGEFARSTTRPGRGWLTPHEAQRVLLDLRPWSRILEWRYETVLLGLDGMERFAWTYWDAQIWATAAVHGVRLVLSEDFSDGLVAGGVTFRDPFRPDFHLDSAIMSANA
jgi:predicted nucleic acid-binding protein